MNKLRKWWKAALAVLLAAVALQIGASLLVRAAPVRAFLTRQLERSFGRPVEVRHYSATLFPTPQLDANAISVGEDPAFGREYFLRAERLSARVRWMGLLRGQFELGTLRLERPSLILVRNTEGRWNLERWLPAMRAAAGGGVASLVQIRIPPIHRLQKIDISDGRVDFKLGDDKASFAFIQVEGAVEQTAPGRWRLDLEAQPWRSGVPLQLAGTVRVRGDVAGTSTRLRPAHLQLSWERSSLADVFRLVRGTDFGVRGTFAGEATADSGGVASSEQKDLAPGDWAFSIQARATGVHRWDLTERDDNPSVGIRVKGRWNPGLGSTTAREIVIETPRSNLRGTAALRSIPDFGFEARFDSAGAQAADFVDWYRAFHPGVAEGIGAEQYFTGSLAIRGWPLRLDEAAFSSAGGRWTVPGLAGPLRVRLVRGGTQRGRLLAEPFAVSIPPPASPLSGGDAAVSKDAADRASGGSLTVSLLDDLQQHSGNVHMDGQVTQVDSILAVAAAFGRNLQHGWELQGRAAGDLRWEWGGGGANWAGHAELTHATLQVAGLNQPVQLESERTDWRNGRRKFTLSKVSGFGATWNGTVEQIGTSGDSDAGEIPLWSFQLHADRLDAAELDRWVGPRARPSWLQRLLPSALGGSAQPTPSSAVLKRIHAEGELKVDDLTVEKIKLKNFRTHAALTALHLALDDAQAQWAGGNAQGNVRATLSNRPAYDVSASFSHVAVTQTPWLAHLAEHLGAAADGSVELRASGIGREALLKSLTGKGELRLSKIELRGWDVPGTMADGEWKTGTSRWPSGSGTFHVSDGGFELNALRLSSASEEFLLKGSVSFSEDADLTAESHATGRTARTPASIRLLTISGPLTGPKVSLEKVIAQQPGD